MSFARADWRQSAHTAPAEPVTDIARAILARHGADLDDYLTRLQIDHDAEAMVRRGATGKVAQARFRFQGITGNSQSSLHDAARKWARKVLDRAGEADDAQG